MPNLPELPITPSLAAINHALTNGHVVLSAPPGSGKTTLVPLHLLHSHWLRGKKILMLEPRRAAARMAARRMASLLHEPIAKTVGYQVRFDRKVSAETRIEVLTEGLLLRRLQHDPELSDTGLIIFDEFHERNLVADLSLALCLDAASALREDLRLMLMSASMDGAELAQEIGAENIQATGQSHPVEIHYSARDIPLREITVGCQQLIIKALSEQDKDVLVFLPGKAEIKRLSEQLKSSINSDIDVLPLHGELDGTQQDRIINGENNTRRIILATDIAETSLTINGVGAVVDSGYQRKPQFDPNAGLSRLQTRSISQASALQRAGRAGRLAPGIAYRAWTATRHQSMERSIQAEILQADLAPLVLELANWGVTNMNDLHWVTPPPAPHIEQAQDLLRQLDALNAKGQITAMGKNMVRLPTHPRLAHMLLRATGPEEQQLAIDLAALLSERDPYRRQPGEYSPTDIELRVLALASYRNKKPVGGYDKGGLAHIDRLTSDFRRQLDILPSKTDYQPSTGTCLAAAFPDRIGMARSGNSARYLLRNGRGAVLPNQDSLQGKPLLVAASLDSGHKDGNIWLATSISSDEVTRLFADQITNQRELFWDKQKLAVVAQQQRHLGALCLASKPVPLEQEDDISGLLIEQLKQLGMSLFEQSEKIQQLQNRLNLLRRYQDNTHWPDFTDEVLLATAQEWLAPFLGDINTLKQLRKLDVISALNSNLAWEKQQDLQRLTPSHYHTPAGTQRAIQYLPDQDPALNVPLQEMLGEQQTPRIADGRIPLTLKLLSPARRPLQVTQDLANFWQTSYHEVKKEMRGRYPKHQWPDDPANANATRFAKRRKQK